MSTTYLVSVKVDAKGLPEAQAKAKAAGLEIAGATRQVDLLDKGFRKLKQAVGGAALVLFGKQAITSAVEFGRSLDKLQTQVGLTAGEVAGLREEVLRLAPELGRAPVELSDALFAIESAGVKGADALEILREAGMGAAIALGTARDVALAVVAATTAYAASNLSASDATAQLAATVRLGNLEAAALVPKLGEIIPLGAQLGVSFAELGANIAAFTRLGVPAAQAVTSLKGVLSALLSPGEEAKKALKGIKISADELRRAVREDGLAATLTDLLGRLHGNTDALRDIIPEITAVANVLGTAGTQGEAYAQIVEEISQATGGLSDAFAKLGDSPGQALDRLSASVDVLKIKIGDELARGLAKGSGGAAELARNLESLAGAAGTLAELIGGTVRVLGELSKHVDLATAALVALMVLKIQPWLISLAANSRLASVAMLQLGGSATTAGKAAAASGAYWNIALLAVGAVTAAVVRWRQTLEIEVQAILDLTNQTGAAWRQIGADAVAALSSGDYDTVNAKLEEYRGKLEEATAEHKRLTDQRAKVTELEAEYEALRKVLEQGGQWKGKWPTHEDLEALAKQLKNAKGGVDDLEREINQANTTAGKYRQSVEALEDGLGKLKKKTGEAGDGLRKMGIDADYARARLDSLKKQLDAIAQAKLEVAAIQARELARALDDAAGTSDSVVSSLARVEVALELGLDPLANLNAATLAWIDKLLLARSAAKRAAEAEAEGAANIEAGLAAASERGAATAGTIWGLLALQVTEAMDAAGIAVADSMAESAESSADAWDDAAARMADSMIRFGDILADTFSAISPALGQFVQSATDAYAAYQGFLAAGGQGGITDFGSENAFDQAAAGSQFGAAIGNSGIFGTGDRGYSAFGGQMSGDYADVGGQIGGIFGPFWGAVGALIGGLISKGADQINIQIESVLGDLQKKTQNYNSRLGQVGNDIADSIISGLEGLERSLGIELGWIGQGIGIKIRDEILTVTVGGLAKEFSADSINAAIEWAILQTLQQIDIQGATANVLAALQSGQIDSLDELQGVLDVAQQLDQAFLSPMQSAVDNLMKSAAQLTATVTEYGLEGRAAAELIRQSFQEVADSLTQTILGLIPGGDWVQKVQDLKDLQQAVVDYNASTEAANQAISDAEDAVSSFGLAAIGTGGSAQESEEEFDDLADAIKVMGQASDDTVDRLAKIDEALLALASASVAQGLLDDLFGRIIALGEQAGIDIEAQLEAAGILADWREAQFQLELAGARIQLEAARALGLVAQATLDFIEGALDAIGNADIDFSVPSIPTFSGGGGGSSQSQDERRRYLRELDLLAVALGGVSASALMVMRTTDGIKEWGRAARDAGLSAAQAAAGIQAQMTLAAQEFLDPFLEIVTAAGETDVETELRHLAEGQQAALETAMVWARQLSQVSGEAVGEIFGRMQDAILAAAEVQRGEILADQIAAEAERQAQLVAEREAVLADIAALGTPMLHEQTRASLDAIAQTVAELGERAREALGPSEDLGDLMAQLADYAAGSTFDVLRGHLGSLAQQLAQLGLELPVEVQQALAMAELELARAGALAAIASGETTQALLALGFTAEEVADLVVGVVDGLQGLDLGAIASGQIGPRPTVTIDGGIHGNGSATSVVNSLASALAGALAELDRWADELDVAAQNLTPYQRELLRLEDRFDKLAETLDEAGASAADLARLEAVYALAREQALQDALDATYDGLQDFLDRLGGGPGVTPKQSLDDALATFNAAAAALAADPTSSIALGAYTAAGSALEQLARDLTGGGSGPLFDRLFGLLQSTTQGLLGQGVPGVGGEADVIPFRVDGQLAAGRGFEIQSMVDEQRRTNGALGRIADLLEGRQDQADRISETERKRYHDDSERLRKALGPDGAYRRAAGGGR